MTRPVQRTVYNPDKEEVFHVAGDFHEDGVAAGALGGYRFNQSREAEVQIRYKDFVLFCDLYRYDDHIAIEITCPKCHNKLWLRNDRKAIEWDPKSGFLSIEPFGCTWEIGRGTEATKDDRIAYGLGLCTWRVGVTRNIAKDA